jgi:two-component system, chemotaxis family, chemotaxis protein CheY
MSPNVAMPVLIVDDDRTTVRIVRGLLAGIGFKNIDDASNGMDALVKMSGKKYGLLIVDWNMEPMNGDELLKQVHGDPQFGKVRILLMTGEAKPEQVIAAKKAGAHFIAKPFTAEALNDKIKGLFQAAHDSQFRGLS